MRGVIITRLAAFTTPHPIIVPNRAYHNQEKPQGKSRQNNKATKNSKLQEVVISDCPNPLQEGKRIQRPPNRS
jgi:hypothetical protein